MSRVLIPFPEQRALGSALAPLLQARIGELAWRRFPDGESLIRVDADLEDQDVAILATLHHPDELALPLRFAAETARELGARSVGLIAPYLAYMRQDMRFHPGEAVSAELFARFLEASFEWLVTVDPHLHRNPTLAGLYGIPASNVASAPAVADWLRANVPDALLIGPDVESAQWVGDIAGRAGLPFQVLDKLRRGDNEVEVSLPDPEKVRGHTPVLVDDIVSTGHTMLAALAQLRRLRLPPAVCVATHAIFVDGAHSQLLAAGAARVISTDSICHATNAISLAPLLAAAADRHFEGAELEPGGSDAAAPEWFREDEPGPT